MLRKDFWRYSPYLLVFLMVVEILEFLLENATAHSFDSIFLVFPSIFQLAITAIFTFISSVARKRWLKISSFVIALLTVLVGIYAWGALVLKNGS